MKAIILAAGLGTRLRPLTDVTPKVMLPIGGKPLLEHHIENLKKFNITDIGINLFYLPKVIESYFGNGNRLGVNLHYTREDNILGTSGSINLFRDWLEDDDFMVIYGDNFCELDYQKIIDTYHNLQDCSGLIGLNHSEIIIGKGLVKIDDSSKILSFVEKPDNPENFNTDLVNAGIYMFPNSILDYIPKSGFSDFSYDIFPQVLRANKSLYGYIINEPLVDIGTLEAYKKIINTDKYK